ncbi:MAG TPA: hypothetical protein VKX28_10740 [Xanthobacteraceae bacterium]|nr:hypothetical protein [Xanthobacteraceae bacterium]
MLRHIAIALATVVIICATACGVSARGGSGGHMGGGPIRGHMGGGNFAAAHVGNFGGFSHSNLGGVSHSFAFRGNHAFFPNRFIGRHLAFRHRFHRRFFFVGAPYAFAYDDCYVRIWTRWGWRWRNLCY